MKKLLCLFATLTVVTASAQHTITYNFLGGVSSFTYVNNNKFVKINEPSSFSITNINTFLYDVKIKGENLAFNAEPPAVFQLFFDTEKFSKQAASASAVLAMSAGGLEDLVEKYNEALRKLEFSKQLFDDMMLLSHVDDKDQKTIIEEVRGADPRTAADPASGTILSYTSTTRVTILRKSQALYDDVQVKFNAVESQFQSMLLAATRPNAEEITLYTDTKVRNGKVKEFDYKGLFNRLALLYDKINNPATFSVLSSPLIAEKDQITYHIEITPKKDLKFGEPRREEKFSVPLPIKGGWKIDFSTGIFFTFGNNVFDRSYRLDSMSVTPPQGTTTVTYQQKIIETSARNQFVPSIGAMMHASHRGVKGLKPCFSLGLGLKSTNLEDASYFIGGGLIMGNQERVILSGGVSGSRFTQLKGSYQNDQLISAKTKVDDLTEKAFRQGWFISITYNLTNKKKEE